MNYPKAQKSISYRNPFIFSKRFLAIAGTLLVLSILSFQVLKIFLASLVTGAIFAIALVPFHRKLCSRFHFKRSLAAITLCLAFICVVVIPFLYVGAKAVSTLQKQPAYLTDWKFQESQIQKFFTHASQFLGWELESNSLKKIAITTSQSITNFVTEAGSTFIASLPNTLLQLIIITTTMYMLLVNYRRVMHFCSTPFGEISKTCLGDVSHIIHDVCADVVFATLFTGLIQTLLVTLSVAAFTSLDPIFIFVLTFVLSMIPIVGAAPVLGAVGIYEYTSGRTEIGLLLGAISIVVGVSDNILRAWMISKSRKDNVALNFLAVIGGMYIWGLPGLFMGPLFVSLSLRLTPVLIREFRNSRNQFQ